MLWNKIGFELEFYVMQKGKFVLADDIAHDDCGYLAEARSEPHKQVTEAIYLLKAAISKLKEEAKVKNKKLVLYDTAELPLDFFTKAYRQFGKGTTKSFNMYGLDYPSDEPKNLTRAGLHVHFSPQKIEVDCLHKLTHETTTYVKREYISKILNIPYIISYLDKAFESEIKQVNRNPGAYEMKDLHGGFEYRSLPATTNLNKLEKVLIELSKKD